ncbi:hypothetical protein KAZ93_04050 [Patescibacteria group bacterium]|nr:hypothetical protein [Patescibacteria group bacterium]
MSISFLNAISAIPRNFSCTIQDSVGIAGSVGGSMLSIAKKSFQSIRDDPQSGFVGKSCPESFHQPLSLPPNNASSNLFEEELDHKNLITGPHEGFTAISSKDLYIPNSSCFMINTIQR